MLNHLNRNLKNKENKTFIVLLIEEPENAP